MAANVLWTRAIELPEGPGVGQAEGDRRHDHQAPAPLPLDLDVPELEPDLQRLGRVGRPRRQVRVDQARDPVRPGRRPEEPEVARPDLGHRLVLLPQARLLGRVDHPPPPLPRRRGRDASSGARSTAATSTTTTSSSATTGSSRPSGWSTRASSARPSATSETVEHVDAPAQRKGQQGDLPFRSMPAHAQTRYAIGLEKESMKGIEATFGPKAQERVEEGLPRVGRLRQPRLRRLQRGPGRRQAGPPQGHARRQHDHPVQQWLKASQQ